MNLFTVGGNRVDGGGAEDDIATGSADRSVGSAILYQEDGVVPRPTVDRVCPRAVVEPVRQPAAEDHI